MKHIAVFCACLLAFGATLAAPARYVTDQLDVPLRTGKTLSNRIVKMLPAGAPVEVLEEDEEGNSRVRTDKGIEGWLLTRYLSAERSARDRLADLQEENRVLQGESQRLTEAIAAARGDAEEARTQAGRLQQESNGLRADLDQLRRAAARPLELAEENRRLQADLQKAREGYETARAEAELLRDTGYRRWFVTGAAVAGGGLLLGLILPRILSRPRRARWDRL